MSCIYTQKRVFFVVLNQNQATHRLQNPSLDPEKAFSAKRYNLYLYLLKFTICGVLVLVRSQIVIADFFLNFLAKVCLLLLFDENQVSHRLQNLKPKTTDSDCDETVRHHYLLSLQYYIFFNFKISNLNRPTPTVMKQFAITICFHCNIISFQSFFCFLFF